MNGQNHPAPTPLGSGSGELDITAAFTGFYNHLDALDQTQADIIKLFHDTYQKQRGEIEALRKAVRTAETSLLRNDYLRRMRQLGAVKPVTVVEEGSRSPGLAITEEPPEELEDLSGQAVATPVVQPKESKQNSRASSVIPLTPPAAVVRRSSSPPTIEEISSPIEEVPAFLERVSHSDTQSKDRPVQKMRPSRGRLGARRGRAAMTVREKRAQTIKQRTLAPPRSSPDRTPSPPILLDDESVQGFSTSKFVAINHAPAKPAHPEPTLSSLPAGISGTPTSKPLPPAASQRRTPSSRALATNLPTTPTLFSMRALKVLLGAGSPTKTVAKVTTDLLGCEYYICFSQDLHFNPPAQVGADAELVDIYGKETPLLATVYPVFKRINKSFMYCGDYQVGSCKIIPHRVWQNSNESVRRAWAIKIQETRWGRELLQEKDFLAAGEVRNITVQEVLGYFDIPDDSRGLRLSATQLYFKSFNSDAYDKLVEGSATFSPQHSPPTTAPQKRRKIRNSGPDVVHGSPRGRGSGRKTTRRATEGALHPVMSGGTANTLTRAGGRRKRDLESDVEDSDAQESD